VAQAQAAPAAWAAVLEQEREREQAVVNDWARVSTRAFLSRALH
jgi:hypothetical protein